MAKKSMIAREKRRTDAVNRLHAKRTALKVIIIDPEASAEEAMAAMYALQKLPRDSSKARQRNRCSMTGRPHGFYRKFGLSRNKLREVLNRGEAPGVVRASW
ncbi:MAG: 30S ribosomal protein S14 [Gammaproteobacteria bacterium]|nr:30S ribosomal protein S14 [Gammaproteobacteria bacterium]